ncbi:hypothetical protein K474DRAFT_1427687 [Panus rudis PR-1116 ss-1]|nr:hypothetical protein K474DRAFT_1427687 [Panus rudis PR-1116 ss-1]
MNKGSVVVLCRLDVGGVWSRDKKGQLAPAFLYRVGSEAGGRAQAGFLISPVTKSRLFLYGFETGLSDGAVAGHAALGSSLEARPSFVPLSMSSSCASSDSLRRSLDGLSSISHHCLLQYVGLSTCSTLCRGCTRDSSGLSLARQELRQTWENALTHASTPEKLESRKCIILWSAKITIRRAWSRYLVRVQCPLV